MPTAGPAGPLILMSSVKHRTHDWDISTRRREVDWVMVVQRRGPEDVGDQALMRGLDTAFPFIRPGLSLSEVGRRSCDRPHNKLGGSPCRGPALTSARLMFDDALMLARCYL